MNRLFCCCFVIFCHIVKALSFYCLMWLRKSACVESQFVSFSSTGLASWGNVWTTRFCRQLMEHFNFWNIIFRQEQVDAQSTFRRILMSTEISSETALQKTLWKLEALFFLEGSGSMYQIADKRASSVPVLNPGLLSLSIYFPANTTQGVGSGRLRYHIVSGGEWFEQFVLPSPFFLIRNIGP